MDAELTVEVNERTLLHKFFEEFMRYCEILNIAKLHLSPEQAYEWCYLFAEWPTRLKACLNMAHRESVVVVDMVSQLSGERDKWAQII